MSWTGCELDGNLSSVQQSEGGNLPDCDRQHQRVVWSNNKGRIDQVREKKVGIVIERSEGELKKSGTEKLGILETRGVALRWCLCRSGGGDLRISWNCSGILFVHVKDAS